MTAARFDVVTSVAAGGGPPRAVAGLAFLTPHLWSRVTESRECWTWTGSRDSHGYGKIGIGKRTVLVHRQAYVDLRGPIPAGLDLDHLCRNILCVNPDHLEPVTPAENQRRARLARGHVDGHCINGHEYSEENTRWINTKTGSRQRRCRTCEAARDQTWNEVRRERRRNASKVHCPTCCCTSADVAAPRSSASRRGESGARRDASLPKS